MRVMVDWLERSVNGKLGSLAKRVVPVILGRVQNPCGTGYSATTPTDRVDTGLATPVFSRGLAPPPRPAQRRRRFGVIPYVTPTPSSMVINSPTTGRHTLPRSRHGP